MDVIYPDKVDEFVATEENSTYPVDNLYDERPKKVWKATSKDAKIFCICDEAGDSAAIINTNATTITAYVYDDAEGDNILENPSFETAGAGGADVFANWNETASDGAIADETSIVDDESHAAKLTAGASVNTKIVSDEITSGFTVGKRQIINFMTRNDGTNPGRYQIEYYTDGWYDSIALTETCLSEGEYSNVCNSFTILAGTTKLRLTLMCPDVSTKIAYFDSFFLIEEEEHTEYDLSEMTGYDDFMDFLDGDSTTKKQNLWITHTKQNNTYILELDIEADTGDTAEIGLISCGEKITFDNPKYGIKRSIIDYSLKKRYYNASHYIKDRAKAYVYTGTLLSTLDSELYNFIQYFSKNIGSNPYPWRVMGTDDNEHIIYAGLENLPEVSYVSTAYSLISFSLKEEL